MSKKKITTKYFSCHLLHMCWFLLQVSPTRLPSSLHIMPINKHILLLEQEIALIKCIMQHYYCSGPHIANVKRRNLIYNKSSQHVSQKKKKKKKSYQHNNKFGANLPKTTQNFKILHHNLCFHTFNNQVIISSHYMYLMHKQKRHQAFQ